MTKRLDIIMIYIRIKVMCVCDAHGRRLEYKYNIIVYALRTHARRRKYT